ncbi:MAG TPA: cell division protein ZapA [bacterium]|nr:cell division protein ZapA [bacterium]
MSSEREVKIYGQVYRVKGDDAERIDRVAKYVDNVMSELLGGPGQGLNARGAVLTALNVADEWFAKKEEWERTVFDLSERVDELLGLLPK